MQDVFVKLWHQRERIEPTALSSLLWQMATQVCLNRLRSRRRRPETGDDELLQRIADDVEADERSLAALALDRLLGREPVSTRVIATLHYVDGLTLEEVAAEVAMSVSGVRKRLRTLRARALADAEATPMTNGNEVEHG